MKQRNNTALFVLFSALCIALASAQTYTPPAKLSPLDVANWVMEGGQIASGSAEPVAVASEGALYVDVSVATAPALWRFDGSAWRMVAGGGGVSESLAAHVASHTDPHGATMTVSQSITVGSGAVIFEFVKLDSGTTIASGTRLAIASAPEYADNAAAVAAGLATGTIYRSSDTLNIVW
jgi:hypothetical protein